MNARVFAIVVAAIVFATAAAAQLPAISWTCPMHPDVLEAKKGACSICGMDLVPVRLVLVYTCPVHAVIEQPKPGKCRICSRDLVQKTAALTFTCAGNRDVSQIEPGKCADGSAMVPRYTPRAHGDHNPKHGGIFFMAPDNWHHLEGTYPAPGRFRVYVYDDFSKPLSTAQARKVRGRVVTKEAFDPKTGTTRELASTPLVLARNGAFFEARIEPLALPAKMTAKISFTSDDKESRFDFAFPAYSSTSAPPAQTASQPSRRCARPPSRIPRRDSSADTLGGQAHLVCSRRLAFARRSESAKREVESLLKSGALGGIYVPALQSQGSGARDSDECSPPQIRTPSSRASSRSCSPPTSSTTYGDLGDAEKAQEAFRSMSAAVAQLDSLVSERR